MHTHATARQRTKSTTSTQQTQHVQPKRTTWYSPGATSAVQCKQAGSTSSPVYNHQSNSPSSPQQSHPEYAGSSAAGQSPRDRTGTHAAAPTIHHKHQSRGDGLPTYLQNSFETLLGHSFEHVRVHPDAHSAALLNAQAYTRGTNIYFAPGAYRPASRSGQGLIAHELAHVHQQHQQHLQPTTHMNGVPVHQSQTLERQADLWARHVEHARELPLHLQADPAQTGAIPMGPAIRFGPFTPTPAETTHTPATIEAMSLSNFRSLTVRQLDWATSPDLQAAPVSLAQYRQIRTFADGTGILRACSSFTLADLIAEGIPAVFTPLTEYARGATTTTTAWLRITSNLPDALYWAQELGKIEAVWNQANLSMVMAEPPPSVPDSPFEKLVDRANYEMGNFINYLTGCSPAPVLSADNGAEIDSFLELRREGAFPQNYDSQITYVRTYHHFTKDTLDDLVSNEAFPQSAQRWFWSRRPLTLVLYPSIDHNNAFHRNAGLETLVAKNDILTIVIEGPGTVAGYSALIPTIASRYGVAGIIYQAMIAGHGNSQIMSLAGSVSGNTVTKDRLGVNGTRGTNTASLINTLAAHMDSNPASRRIILDGCLTNSSHVRSALRASPTDAATDVATAIAGNPTLTQFVESHLGSGSTVLGANASFAPASTSFTTPGSSDLTLSVPGDPDLVSSKLAYVEFGTEPTGCLRAVLQCWSDDQLNGTTNCRDAMRRRIAAGQSTHVASPSPWREAVIQPLYDLIANHYWSNGETIRQLEHLADSLFLLYWPRHTTASELHGALSPLSGNVSHINQVLTSIAGQSRYANEPRVAIIVEQAWMQHNNSRFSHFLTALSAYSDAGAANRHIDMGLVRPHVSSMLSLPPASPPAADQLRLALIATVDRPLTPPIPPTLPVHIDFLRQVKGANAQFPAGLSISTELGRLASESDILDKIGQPLSGTSVAVGGGSAPPPRANIDPDRDATALNDFHVTPLRARGRVDTAGGRLRVRSRPTTRAAGVIFDHLSPGTIVRIIGEYNNWYAIERPGRSGFVYKNYLTVLP